MTLRIAVIVLATIASISCGASTDAVAALEPLDVVTGWFDDGILENGKNKLVPSVSMKLRNKSDKELKSVQINAIFRRVGEQEMWGEYFGWAIPRSAPLVPGAETRMLVMRSTLGYTGDQPRMQMLQNREFVDAKVEIYLKQGSKVLAKLAEYPIQRQLITRSADGPTP
jgi:predicted transglutaminase-like cysteine proteinase